MSKSNGSMLSLALCVFSAYALTGCQPTRGPGDNCSGLGPNLVSPDSSVALLSAETALADGVDRWGAAYSDSSTALGLVAWESGQWNKHPIMSSTAAKLTGSFFVGEMAGRFHVFFSGTSQGTNSTVPATPAIYESVETSPGVFNPLTQIAGQYLSIAAVGSSDAQAKILLALNGQGPDYQGQIWSAESSSPGSWYAQATGLTGTAIGTGYVQDGSAWIAYTAGNSTLAPGSPGEIHFAKRTGSKWADIGMTSYSVGGTMPIVSAHAAAPQFAFSGNQVVVVATSTFYSSGSFAVFGATADFSTGTITAGQALTSPPGNGGNSGTPAVNVQFVDDTQAYFSIFDTGSVAQGSIGSSGAVIGGWTSAGFTGPVAFQSGGQELYVPAFFSDSCGGTYVGYGQPASLSSGAIGEQLIVRLLQKSDYGAN